MKHASRRLRSWLISDVGQRMSRSVAIVVLLVTGCVHGPRTVQIATLTVVQDPVYLRAEIVEIAMPLADVEFTLRSSSIKREDDERYIALVRDAGANRRFTMSREDEVGSVLSELVAPALLAKGRARVVDLRTKRTVAFITSGWSERGEHGPYFCLPDGSEFLRHIIMVE